MRRVPIIITSLLIGASVLAAEKEKPAPRLMIQVEYRQDALDFDDIEKRFFRESARLSFGKSSVSFTHVNIGLTKENRFTWNICIRGISPYFECILGNYYANFGAGLLVGKKTALSPDLFSRTLAISTGNPFSPCSSGNPYFSFHGITAGAHYSSHYVSISLHGFYSFRNRFVRNDRQYPDLTGTSLNSILIRTKRDYRYTEPVVINDFGYSFIIRVARHFTLQSYFIHTSIWRSNSHSLLWNYGDQNVPAGEKKFYGYGFYFQYRDDYILVFIDLCFPNRVISSPSGGSMTVRGYGIMYSLAFRHEACSLSFTGKQTDKNFYSPYSSGKSYPETACVAELSVRPLRYLTIGGAFFNEKNIIPSMNEQYIRYSRREQLFLLFGAPMKGSFSIRFICAEEGKKEGMEPYLKLKSSARVFIMKSILFSFVGTIQRKGSSLYSGSLNGGIKFSLWHFLTVQMHYSRFFIAPRNSLYTASSRPADSISRGIFIKSSSHILSCCLLVRFNGCHFSVDYLHHFAGRRTLQYRVEAYGTCLL